nr:hypothetical protein [Tanacetum cinerariifolium]
MAALRYKDEHNKVGYLLKPNGSDDYHQIIDFLRASHVRYALTHDPIIFDSLVKQFWSTATLRASELGPPAILATIDKTPYTITEDLVRSRLQLADDGGIADLPIAEIYSGMDNLGYVTEGKGMVSNIGNAKKFLMYPRFLQIILGIETRVTRHYKVLVFSSKIFSNTRLNFTGHPMPLLPAMLLQAQAGEGAEVVAQAILQPVPVPDQPTSHLSTPSKQPTSDRIAPVLKHGQSSNPNTASFSRSHEADAGTFTPVDNAPMGGDFHTSPPRSSQAPLASQPSGGAEDPITLTALLALKSQTRMLSKSKIKRYTDIKPNHELIYYCLKNPPYKFTWADKQVPIFEGSPVTRTETYMETYRNVSQGIRDQLNAKAEAVQIILTGIDNDIYLIVDACSNACKMWKAIKRLKQGESINVQDLETNLYWEFGKFTSQEGESLESYYSRFYKMMNELIR